MSNLQHLKATVLFLQKAIEKIETAACLTAELGKLEQRALSQDDEPKFWQWALMLDAGGRYRVRRFDVDGNYQDYCKRGDVPMRYVDSRMAQKVADELNAYNAP